MALTVGTGQGLALTPAGALNIQSTAAGNVSTPETDLHTFILPANTLVTTNRGIRWEGSGIFAATAAAKTLKIYFGAQMFTLALPAGLLNTLVEWRGQAKIIRTGSNAQRYENTVRLSVAATGAVLEFAFQGTLTQTETSTIIIKATGTATTNNDIVQNTSVVSYF